MPPPCAGAYLLCAAAPARPALLSVDSLLLLLLLDLSTSSSSYSSSSSTADFGRVLLHIMP